MKAIKVLLSLLTAAVILFASALPVSAIGFEAEAVYESVFVIHTGNSMGSGFAIGENCIVTNAHVLEDARYIVVSTYGGTEYQASVLGINETEDIAVLAIEGVSFPYLPVADLSTVKTGDDIYAIGAPKGMPYTLTKGGISAKERTIRRNSYIQIDAPINEGNSGGPLLNDTGQVLGMNTLKLINSEGIGLAIPITSICSYILSLGIELDDGGNVIGAVSSQAEPSPLQPIPSKSRHDGYESGENEDEDNDEDTDRSRSDGCPAVTHVAFTIAGLSVAGNVVLFILLIDQKKKNKMLTVDPSERTDFEIDFWE